MSLDIKKVFKQKLSLKVLLISKISENEGVIVKKVVTENLEFIIKISEKNKKNLRREALALKKLEKLKEIPKLILEEENYIIQEFVEGTPMNNSKLDNKDKKKILKTLGAVIRKIHNIKLEGFGEITKSGIGEYGSFEEFILFERKENLRILKKRLDSKNYQRLLSYLEENKEYNKSQEKALLHTDYEEWNIIINNNEISGIIDFGDLCSGRKLYDLARPYINYCENDLFKYLLEGYGEVNLEELEYYVVITLLWLIPYLDLKSPESQKKIGILKQIIEKVKVCSI